jgi:hypothetical protein
MMWNDPRFLTDEQPHALDCVREPHTFEVWEASENLLPFFQVAGHLSMAEAINVAERHAGVWPRQPVVVLDQSGALKHSAFQTSRASSASSRSGSS